MENNNNNPKKMNVVFSKAELNSAVNSVCSYLLNTVIASFGPNGSPSIISSSKEKSFATKDGITIFEYLVDSFPKNSPEKRIAAFIKQAAERTASEVGDGTTTTALLFCTLWLVKENLETNAGNRFNSSHSVISKLFNENLHYLEELYRSHSKNIESREDIKRIALSSSNGDEDIAEMIASAFDQIGKNGTIIFKESNDGVSSLDVKNGFWFNGGFSSSQFCNVPNRQLCSFENPLVFVTTDNLVETEKCMNLFAIAQKVERPLVIIANSVEGQMLKACLVSNARKNSGVSGCNVCIVNPPGFGTERYEMLKDIAVATGSKLWQKGSFQDLSSLSIEDLGTCKTVNIGLYHTHFIDPIPNEKNLEERIDQLKDQIFQEPLQEVCIALQTRLSRLRSSLAILSVGGNTYAEMIERKHRVEDAINAVHSALNRGYVLGAGQTGRKIFESLEPILWSTHDWFNNLSENCDSAEKILREKGLSSSILISRFSKQNKISITSSDVAIKNILGVALIAQETKLRNLDGTLFSESCKDVIEPTNCFISALKNAVSVFIMLYCSSSFLLIPEGE